MKVTPFPIFLCLALLQSDIASANDQTGVSEIKKIARQSSCAATDWKNRGLAKEAYYEGIALVFAKAICNPERTDVQLVAQKRGAPGSKSDKTDALTWYDSIFRSLSMTNDVSGNDTLRHAYTLLIGLGMRESSGQYCVGRDRSANFSSADSAEAGLFQTSWGAHAANETLSALNDHYSADRSQCLLDVFSNGVHCSAWDAKIWGTGKGADWQKLTKSCPAFATEYAAVLLRVRGGSKGEFGPLRRHQAEVKEVCDSMLSQVEKYVETHPETCSALD
ncbi:hypothetical protein [Rhizobium sp. NRK18]|uniref:hypothetical protein n=1 Tax=Rhizobium sp. NRK18 TaxID=2964667 RepID=UPI0021C36F44|nr:hypothetical protein [Rhizobium sp. NRK18]MCQ2003661.1 hypothetical protein [Rhizobium sp. NRK18]